MPRRTDIHNILIIGSGPIIIGQGCEFDYSGTQACKALREEGFRVVLLNSNPATIMTDPGLADATYIEPITPEFIEKILIAEKAHGHAIDALLPTLGGQTGLNCAVEAADAGILDRHGVKMIGANRAAIHKAEDRTEFKKACLKIGVDVPRSGIAHNWDEVLKVIEDVKLPACIRPAYTLGGEGGGFVRSREELEEIARRGLAYSRIHQILIEEDLYGWKEFELEVMRDRADNVVIICGIENVDAMGVHTGDSITVAPIQTLTDKEYQKMRDSAIAIIREIGVETGGSNIQFAVHPQTGRQVAIEMNPRVSRSSALASKATGYPIARVAAKLAVGYTLDELPNDITKKTPASFEPTIDYCVVKVPRWTFEKFPDADETLGTQMKSVGEAMAIGRTFKEAFQKAIRSMEIKRFGYGLDANDKWLASQRRVGAASRPRPAPDALGTGHSALGTPIGGSTATEAPPDTKEEHADRWPIPSEVLKEKLTKPSQGRPYYVRYAFKMGWSVDQVYESTKIDPWFLENLKELVEFENDLCAAGAEKGESTRRSLMLGYSDVQRGTAFGIDRNAARKLRPGPAYKLVDTCAAEFEAYTPYYYSSHEVPTVRADGQGAVEDEVRISQRQKVIVLGGGPNRIGQGIEFDYCCCHAAFSAKAAGYEAVMVNSNPETVSTDYDTSDLLFFEPLTHEDVLNLVERLNGAPLPNPPGKEGLVTGVVVQFGGQTPLNLAQGLKDAGVPILGTSPEMIHLAEDREEFAKVLRELSLLQPPSGIARTLKEARQIAARIGYPVLVRPSYVLGGRAMQVCNNEADLTHYMERAVAATDRMTFGEGNNPILVDKFLTDAIEVDVDAVADFGQGRTPGDTRRRRCVVCGVMEHIEEAGIHSGDSTCTLPPYSLGPLVVDELKRSTERLARRLNVCGLMNVQFAIQNRTIYVLEVNPRASRTVPYVAKATGVPWAAVATRVMLGETLDDVLASHNIDDAPWPKHVSIKAPVFPFTRFPGVDVVLGPEMRSTGEVMAIDDSFGLAFAKAQIATNLSLPMSGNVLVSVNDADKPRVIPIARDLHELGFKIFSTIGTRSVLGEVHIPSTLVSKQPDGSAPYLKDLIDNGTLHLLINTPIHSGSASDEGRWRAAAASRRIPIITTLAGGRAVVEAIRAMRRAPAGEELKALGVRPLQSYYGTSNGA